MLRTAVTVLTTKSLIKIIENGILGMHDQLRDMGRQIVQREDYGDPGKRSRLWDHDEIMSVLIDEKGTRSIQGVFLDMEKNHKLMPEESYQIRSERRHASFMRYLMEQFKKLFHHKAEKEYPTLCTKSFKPMVVLRLLTINNVNLNGNLKLIPAKVKWLQWKGCPFKCFPLDSCPRDLAVLDLSESEIVRIWDTRWWDCYKNKVAEKLLVLNLEKCFFLTEIPDLSQHCLLEKLNLERCVQLVKLHKSLGDLNALVHLNLKDCFSLVEFPGDITGLKNLEILILSGCLKLKELPENIGSMKSLRELLADETAIEKLPVSLFRLDKLERLSLKACKKLTQLPICIGKLNSLRELILNSTGLEEIPDSIGSLTNLEILNLMHTPLGLIPESIGDLRSLVELDLANTSIKEVPASIGNLAMLKYLSFWNCRYLTQLPNSIKGFASLVRLTLDGTCITEVPDQFGSLDMTEELHMRNCEWLRYLPVSFGNMTSLRTVYLTDSGIVELPDSIGNLERLEVLQMDRCKQLTRLPNSFGKLKRLRYLAMEGTPLIELPENFGMLSSLSVLKMGKPPDIELPQNIQEQGELKHVVLPMSFSNLSSLTELNARAWKFSSQFSDDFEKLSSLQILNLEYNNFCNLPTSLSGLSTLKRLLLSQ